jgi:hypothetical protein
MGPLAGGAEGTTELSNACLATAALNKSTPMAVTRLIILASTAGWGTIREGCVGRVEGMHHVTGHGRSPANTKTAHRDACKCTQWDEATTHGHPGASAGAAHVPLLSNCSEDAVVTDPRLAICDAGTPMYCGELKTTQWVQWGQEGRHSGAGGQRRGAAKPCAATSNTPG